MNDPEAIIYDADALKRLHDDLTELYRCLDSEEYVPERYTQTLGGLLANMDSEALMLASTTAHRLWLWAKYPRVHDESYVEPLAVATPPDPFSRR